MDSTTQFQQGQQIGPCQIVRRLGAGAMGIVYQAQHAEHGVVCIKVIKEEHAPDGVMLRRFHREAEAARRINHPNVVRCFGLERHGPYLFLVQEFVSGGDLDGYIKSKGGRLALAEALRLSREVALGLAAAHAIGLVHRDLKPGNVLLDDRKRAKIADLGLVLQVDGEPLDGRTILTQKGQALGTPLYMAPEQWAESHEVDHRADLYALGVMLHQMVSGKYPITGKNLSTLMRAHLMRPAKPLRAHLPDAPEMVEKVILRLLEKEAEDRPKDAQTVAAALGRVAKSLGMTGAMRAVRSPTATQIQPATGPISAGQAIMPPAQSRMDSGSEMMAVSPQQRPPSSTAASPIADSQGASASSMPTIELGVESDPLIGIAIGNKFMVEKVLGKGGMGVVYKARHTLLNNYYAIKLLLPRFAQDKEFRERFLREAKMLQAFTHEGAVTLREFGEHEGSLYMAIDFAPGVSLKEVLKNAKRFDEERVLNLARQVLPCLQKAHDAGLVHRDLKPDNLLVETRADGSERVRILDFGIAKVIDEAAAAAEGDLTGTGITLGTPYYMSPEQDAGDPVDGRSDLYSLACVLYELCTGSRPIQAKTIRKLRYKIQFETPKNLAEVAGDRLSAQFTRAVMRALEKDRDKRPANAIEFLADLQGLEVGAASGGSGLIRSQMGLPGGPSGARHRRAPTDGTIAVGADTEFAGDDTFEGSSPTLAVGTDGAIAAGAGRTRVDPPDPKKGSALLPILLVLVLLLGGGGGAFVYFNKEVMGELAFADLPARELATNGANFELSGRVSQPFAQVTVKGENLYQKTVQAGDDGRFSVPVVLIAGRNKISLEAGKKRDKPQVTRDFVIERDETSPSLSFAAAENKTLRIGRGGSVFGKVKEDRLDELAFRIGAGDLRKLPLPGEDGAFEIALADLSQASQLTVVARDKAGNITRAVLQIEFGLALNLEAAPEWTAAEELVIKGQASYGPVEVTINAIKESSDDEGRFALTVPLREGENVLEVTVKDGEASAKESRTVTRDSRAPQLTLAGWDPRKKQAFVDIGDAIEGGIDEPNLARFTADGQEVAVDARGAFKAPIGERKEGDVIALEATDKAGNVTRAEVTVTKTVKLLKFKDLPRITREAKVMLAGQATQAPVTITVGGEEYRSDSNGNFRIERELVEGLNTLTIVVRGPNGSEQPQEVPIIRDSTDPEFKLEGLNAVDSSRVYLGKSRLFKGQVVDANLASLTINGETVSFMSGGDFSLDLRREEDPKLLELVALDKAGNQSRTKVTAYPPIRFKTIQGRKDWTNSEALKLEVEASYTPYQVSAESDTGAPLLAPRPVLADPTTALELRLKEGRNALIIKLKDKNGDIAREEVIVYRDSNDPQITIENLKDNNLELGPDLTLRGQVKDASQVELLALNQTLPLDEAGRFSIELNDTKEPQLVIIKATDQAGNTTRLDIRVATPRAREAQELAGQILYDLKKWKAADEGLQDLAVDQVYERIRGEFEKIGAQKFVCGSTGFRIYLFRHKKTGMEMALLPGGEFDMGSGESGKESPVHRARIRPFLLARYELRQSEWNTYKGNAKFIQVGDDLPAHRVSWQEAFNWCKNVGDGLRLPSESEWEFACRAGTKTRYFWGDKFNKAFCWSRINSGGKLKAVTEHRNKTNAFGLVDMLGNVQEWVQDSWFDDYNTGPNNHLPRIDSSNPFRPMRGGYYSSTESSCRSAYRTKFEYTSGAFKHLGFRVARSID